MCILLSGAGRSAKGYGLYAGAAGSTLATIVSSVYPTVKLRFPLGGLSNGIGNEMSELSRSFVRRSRGLSPSLLPDPLPPLPVGSL